MLRTEVDISDFSSVVQALIRRGSDFRPAMRDIGEELHGSVMKNFAEQGRPEAWKKLALATLIARYTRGNRERRRKRRVFVGGGTGYTAGFTRALGKGKILMDKGRLRGSITWRAKRFSVAIGTNLVYSRVQNLGGDAGRGHKTKIPARPYLLIQDEDRRYIDDAVQDHLMDLRGV